MAVDGQSTNSGSESSPWDISSTLRGKRNVAPGDIVWIRGGTYKGPYDLTLKGTKDAPIIVRAYPGERATISDGQLFVREGADYVWVWGLEISSDRTPAERISHQEGSHPTDIKEWDGMDVYAGAGCKFVDLVIHDNLGNGIGWWLPSTDSEVEGCIIYDNGFTGPARHHGHAIYTQNKDGTKTIYGCYLQTPGNGSLSIQAYGTSKTYVDNYDIEKNIVTGLGSTLLVGGGRPSHGIRVVGNMLYDAGIQLGWVKEGNTDGVVEDNITAGRGRLTIIGWTSLVNERNSRELPVEKATLVKDKYDPTRAMVAIYNGGGRKEVGVDVSGFLSRGTRYRVMKPTDMFGSPVAVGTCDGSSIHVPADGDFSAVVIVAGG